MPFLDNLRVALCCVLPMLAVAVGLAAALSAEMGKQP
jgi:hypothetical protein